MRGFAQANVRPSACNERLKIEPCSVNRYEQRLRGVPGPLSLRCLGCLHERTTTYDTQSSENLWYRSGEDWKIDHAGKASEAQETEQSAECIARDSLTLDALSAGVKQYGAGVTRVMILERSVSDRIGMGETYQLWQGESL